MSEREDGPDDKDPAPLKHSDAQRISGDQEQQPASPAGEDEPADDDEKD